MPGYKLKLVVVEGEFLDRVVWHDIWLNEPALPMAKRDLGKLGITSLAQLEQPVPEGIIVVAKVALRKNEDQTEYNRVSWLDFVCIESPDPEPFAPHDEPVDDSTVDAAGFDWVAGQQNGVPKAFARDPPAFGSSDIRPGDDGSSIGEPPFPPMPNAILTLNLNGKPTSVTSFSVKTSPNT
jgi:hypothetical protein